MKIVETIAGKIDFLTNLLYFGFVFSPVSPRGLHRLKGVGF